MGFDLSNYETVKERKKKFYADYKEKGGKIIVELISPITDAPKYTVFKALLYIGDTLVATGHAFEERDTELKKGKNGPYTGVNYTSWTENAEESAIGRALDNYGYAGNDKCSKEEMKRVERVQTFATPTITIEDSGTAPKTTDTTFTAGPTFTPPTTEQTETGTFTPPNATATFTPPTSEGKKETPNFKAPAFSGVSKIQFKQSTNTFAKYKRKGE